MSRRFVAILRGGVRVSAFLLLSSGGVRLALAMQANDLPEIQFAAILLALGLLALFVAS